MPKIVITEKNLPNILGLINTWEGKLTWDLLCKKVAIMIDVKGGVQRQSLSSYKDIQDAYSRRKTFLKERFSQPEPTEDRDVTLEYLIKKVALLENELARLNSLNDAYKQRFIVWQYNAYMHGVRMTAFFKIVVAQSCFKQPLSAPARVSRAAPDLASRHR